jgi:hypothetical protein
VSELDLFLEDKSRTVSLRALYERYRCDISMGFMRVFMYLLTCSVIAYRFGTNLSGTNRVVDRASHFKLHVPQPGRDVGVIHDARVLNRGHGQSR